ncbi:class E sortase [Nocardioides sp.]|uniref:class E sortase n=1 Tax=Nocardioides sp. TaxID=35761 RepID=UPI0035274C4B
MPTQQEEAPEAPPAQPPRRRSPAQRAVTVAGVLLVLGGVGLLGWVGWEMYGTNWVSHRKQAAAVEDLDIAWEQGRTFVEVDGGTASAVVRIPRFGKDYQVPLLQGTSDEALASGFGEYDGSAAPGARGNFALAGHRVTHGEPLRRMPELQPGDEVIVDTAEATYTYVLDTGGDDLEVPFTATWVLDDQPVNPDGGVEPPADAGRRLLTLTTCSELFHTDNRLVAFGHLVDTQPR